MSAVLSERAPIAELGAKLAGDKAAINHVGSFDVIDLGSVSTADAYRTLSKAAGTTGVAFITNLPVRPPIAAIRNLFTRLYADPSLASRFNATYPKRGVFKTACLGPAASPNIDQKTTIDLSITRLQELRRLDPTLVEALGQDFSDVLAFYAAIETDVLPILTQATSCISGADLSPMHNGTNNHLRLIDYFPCAEPSGPRCGSHRDYNTYTIVFQDGTVGGLEFEIEGKWIKVPASVEAIVSWGWCGAILSNDTIKAAKHRVMKTWPLSQRRTTAVVFVAPDLDRPLKPVGGLEKGCAGWRQDIAEGNMSIGAFKEVISKKWRRREGTEPGEVVEGAQDREVEAFLKPC
ncbi:Clavaminate synthase-like protein [Byssothecium circinans]|uniref:Clavaminate synthase-like protein n=1 Tax=Byssothecium circinans TaxID=147558 RepID=A0A6A5TZR9_9PLEO|nr:Clavaminate synthase-like protein [Byssothecium circinans]